MKDKLKFYKDEKRYFWVQRKVGKESLEKSHGYVVDFSRSFVLLNDTDDFELDGYSIFSIKSIANNRFTAQDRHYDKIMRLEGLKDKIRHKYKVDLTNWPSIFKALKSLKLNVIIENEDPDDKSFDIGPITKVTKTAVYLRYFDSQGRFNKEPTKIPFDLITVVKFDGRYVNTMSKYLRHDKSSQK